MRLLKPKASLLGILVVYSFWILGCSDDETGNTDGTYRPGLAERFEEPLPSTLQPRNPASLGTRTVDRLPMRLGGPAPSGTVDSSQMLTHRVPLGVKNGEVKRISLSQAAVSQIQDATEGTFNKEVCLLSQGPLRTEKDVEIVAFADVCEERRLAAQELFPEARIYPDYVSLLEQESDVLDFVDISTPPAFHAEIAIAAFHKGLHVLCEKPLCTSVAQAQRMIQKAKEVKRVLFPAHNYKHAPIVKAIQETIDSGQIGKVTQLNLLTFRNTHAKGIPEWKTDWRRDKQISGGGIAMDHGSHSFYLTFDWLKDYPIEVTASMARQNPAFDTEDNFSATLIFPKGRATLNLSWTAGVRKVIYCIQGEKGAITVDDDQMQVATMKSLDSVDAKNFGNIHWEVKTHAIHSHWMDSSHVTWFQSLFSQFKKAIDQEDYVGKEAQEAYRCVQIITAAYQSAEQNSVAVPLLNI